MNIQSSAFTNNTEIPRKYSCEGPNINPPLTFSDIPKHAQSLVLTVEDPDAVSIKPWVHWLVLNIPPTTTKVDEHSIPQGGTEGIGSSQTSGYQGPCPPSGKHRYIFKLYALDTVLDIAKNSDRKTALDAMQGHILEQTELIGLYEKKT